jgi:predicted ATPase/class 3 adenylate cyclase
VPDLPTGTVTFLFTDVEGSTRLWEQHPAAMKAATARHDALVEEAVMRHGGTVVRPRGEGDSRFAVFARATDAVTAAAALQVALTAEEWPTPAPLLVRMALHTGEADLREGDYYGSAVNRCARLRGIAHGGQVLLSQPTYDLVRDALPGGVSARDAGEHRLADLIRPERVFSLLHPALPSEFPPLRSLDAYPHNLPVQLTSFIGREKELADLAHALTTTRLLTVTGTGGCGKTRLALQVAADQVDRFPEGVWVVELATLADPTLVPQAVAAALGVREEPGQPLLATLLAALRARSLLLVLDNCEHLLDACARLAEAILRGCPRVQMLATSREVLGIGGEVTRRVPSLTVPRPEQLPPFEQLIQYEAVRLFVERALAVQPAFVVTNQNAPAVAQICWRLDGIPLAIELAAARARVVTVEQIARRLDDRFRLLSGGSRTALRRQQTLRALVDWSHDLLPEPERVMLRRLAVFSGGWTLEAAEVAGAGDGIEALDVLDLLTELVDKSLVVVEGSGEEARYRLLETLREYALEKLAASGEAEAIHSAHATFYVGLAERLGETLLAGENLRRGPFVDELDNFRAALRWFADAGDWSDCLRLVGSLSDYWHFGSHLGESAQWLELALRHQLDVPPATRGRVLSGVGLLAFGRGDYATSEMSYRESTHMYRESGDERGAVNAQLLFGGILRDEGKHGEASVVLEEGLRLSEAAGDPRLVALARFQLGLLARQLGDYRRAWTLLTETTRSEYASASIYNLGLVAEDQGDFGRARALYAQSIALFRESGLRFLIPFVIEGFATMAARQGQDEKALVLAGGAATAREHFGSPIPPVMKERLDSALASARRRLGAIGETAWSRGQGMTMEQAVAYALEEEGT